MNTLQPLVREPYFNTPELCERLRYHAMLWDGTPFAPRAAVLGAGVDCVNLCAQVYIALGFLHEFNPPKYTMDGGKHRRLSQLTEWLDAHGSFQKIERTDTGAWLVNCGDVVCFQIGRSAHHAGLMLNENHFIHCLYANRVMVSTLNDRTFQRLFVAAYRPTQTRIAEEVTP